MKTKKPVVLVILDGWGEWDVESGNAILKANLPTINKLNKYYPKLLLQASGLSVGLPWGVRGNSEVGHQAMGVGQIIFQYLPAINMAIQNSTFSENKTLLKMIDHVNKNDSKLHLVGLTSDGSVHSHISHLTALLGLAKQKKVKEVCIHAITDGRDTPPQSAEKYIKMIQAAIKEFKVGQIASLMGRYYAMDRNNNWDRLEKAFQAIVYGEAIEEKDPLKAIKKQYDKKVTDEFLEPVVIIDKNDEPVGKISENDAVICFNFRKDRSRQISEAFVKKDFKEFQRPDWMNKVKYAGFIEYEKDLLENIVFPEQVITTRVGEIVSKANKKQLRIAETEKFAHVTYFFNGGAEKPYKGEDRILIPSKKVPSYDKCPEMSAHEITDKLIKAVNKKDHDFILVNYANPDMVGHTGNLKAGIKAVETVDECLGRLVDAVLEQDGQLIVTADHGNAEEMVNLTTYEKDTEHSTNPVPCWFIDSEGAREEPLKNSVCTQIDGMIIDISPTILDLLSIKVPKDMVGRSLLKMFKIKN